MNKILSFLRKVFSREKKVVLNVEEREQIKNLKRIEEESKLYLRVTKPKQKRLTKEVKIEFKESIDPVDEYEWKKENE